MLALLRWDDPQIPDEKPALSWIHTGRDGTIWVRVAQPGRVIPEEERTRGARTFVHEPIVLDVFDSDGRYLGQVRPTPDLRIDPHPVFDRDHLWGVVVDEAGVEFVARFRIEWN